MSVSVKIKTQRVRSKSGRFVAGDADGTKSWTEVSGRLHVMGETGVPDFPTDDQHSGHHNRQWH